MKSIPISNPNQESLEDQPHRFVDKAVNMGEWKKILIYCIHCGLTPEKLRINQATTDQRVAEARIDELKWAEHNSDDINSAIADRIATLTQKEDTI